MSMAKTVSDEYQSIAEYLERVEPMVPEWTGTPVDVERADELIITANQQGW